MFKASKRLLNHAETSQAIKLAEKTCSREVLWRNTPPERKRAVFFKAAELLDKKRPTLIETMAQEIKTPAMFGNIFIDDSISYLRELGSLQACHPNVLPVQAKDRLSMVFREPVGTVLGIVPWNAAAVLAIRAAACPLAAGCPVIIKSSPLAQKSHQQTLEVFAEAGLPSDVLSILHVSEENTPQTVSQLIAHDSIKKINFTGSYNVGRIIAIEAAKHVKPVLLELGGKGAVIVDLDTMSSEHCKTAAETIVIGAWANGGHVCMSTERVYIVGTGKRVEKFIQLLAATAEHMAGLPFLQSESITEKQASKVRELVQDAVRKDCKVLVKHNVSSGNNELILPRIILQDVSRDMDIYHQETFGPVCFVNIVQTLDQAIEEVNTHDYGLNNAIWSGNISAAIDVARQLQCGAVHINGNTIFDHGTIPHGGTKKSGYGRFGAQWGLDEFSSVKTVTIPGY